MKQGERSMRVAAPHVSELSDEFLTFASQLGVSGVVLMNAQLPGEKRWEHSDVRALVERAAAYGLRIESLENTPMSFYRAAMLGLPGRDEAIENYQETIRNVGRAGVEVLGFHWMPNGVWRTGFGPDARGGAGVSSFDLALAPPDLTEGRIYTDDDLWATFEYFLRAVVPVAEEAGVRLALHPDDPPVASLGGVARIFRNAEAFERALSITPSRAFGLDFCLGTWSEMGIDHLAALDRFSRQGRVVYCHFRDVVGTVPRFTECFLGEGNYSPLQAMLILRRNRFDGFVIDDHVPRLIGDSEWCHRGRANLTGYLQGMLGAVDGLVDVPAPMPPARAETAAAG